jgi:hypothetical protein
MTLDRRALLRIACASGLTALVAPVEAADDGTLGEPIEALRKAMLSKDKGQFEMLCADELTYGHSSGKLETKAEFITGATSPKWHWKSLEFLQLSTKLVGDAGIARSIMTGAYEIEGGTVKSISDGVLMVWQRQGSQWRLIARQAYKT